MLESLSIKFLTDFDYYLKTEKGHKQITINKSIQRVRKIIKLAIAELDKLPKKTEKLRQLIGYYKNHEKRMQYHIFKEQGLQIGSGAIEAAHKDVLQKRLKLSGQR